MNWDSILNIITPFADNIGEIVDQYKWYILIGVVVLIVILYKMIVG